MPRLANPSLIFRAPPGWAEVCHRLRGGSCRDCPCRLPNEGGWIECPPEARGELVAGVDPRGPLRTDGATVTMVRFATTTEAPKMNTAPVMPSPTGEFCDGCGGFLVRTGTCLTCQDCGSSTGGCS